MTRKLLLPLLAMVLIPVLFAGTDTIEQVKDDAELPTALEWYKSKGAVSPPLIVTPKDAAQSMDLRNFKGSVVVLFSYNFKGVPWSGVPRDKHC